jgi:hypothetical protein
MRSRATTAEREIEPQFAAIALAWREEIKGERLTSALSFARHDASTLRRAGNLDEQAPRSQEPRSGVASVSRDGGSRLTAPHSGQRARMGSAT